MKNIRRRRNAEGAGGSYQEDNGNNLNGNADEGQNVTEGGTTKTKASTTKTTTYITNTAVTTSSRENTEESLTDLSSESPGTHGYEYTSLSPNQVGNNAALATILPLVTAIFLLLLIVGFIILRKKTIREKGSKQDLVRSQSKETKLELGDIKHLLNNCAETDKHGKERKRAIAKQNAINEVTYEEVDENAHPKPQGSAPQRGNIATPDIHKVHPQESYEYEEANVPGTQKNYRYEEAKVEGNEVNQGYEKAKGRRTRDDQGHEMAKVTGPFYHTLDPDAPTDSSYMSVSGSKQDGGYDNLDRQQNPSQTKSKTNPSYDMTERIGKGDDKVETRNEIGSEYSAIGRSSANTSAYDKLDHTRRSHEVGISSNDYNVLQPQEKELRYYSTS